MRELVWIGGSRADLSAFPDDVKQSLGFALFEVQKGQTPGIAKPLTQFGVGVFELRDDFDTDTYRAIYVVKLARAIYVLHAFKKKSKSGRAMPREVIAMIERRLKRAKEIEKESL